MVGCWACAASTTTPPPPLLNGEGVETCCAAQVQVSGRCDTRERPSEPVVGGRGCCCSPSVVVRADVGESPPRRHPDWGGMKIDAWPMASGQPRDIRTSAAAAVGADARWWSGGGGGDGGGVDDGVVRGSRQKGNPGARDCTCQARSMHTSVRVGDDGRSAAKNAVPFTAGKKLLILVIATALDAQPCARTAPGLRLARLFGFPDPRSNSPTPCLARLTTSPAPPWIHRPPDRRRSPPILPMATRRSAPPPRRATRKRGTASMPP